MSRTAQYRNVAKNLDIRKGGSSARPRSGGCADGTDALSGWRSAHWTKPNATPTQNDCRVTPFGELLALARLHQLPKVAVADHGYRLLGDGGGRIFATGDASTSSSSSAHWQNERRAMYRLLQVARARPASGEVGKPALDVLPRAGR
jgi:hypothetical protein